MRDIKNIYIGLPIALVDKIFWVQKEFQTNPLSHEEGGFDVVVEYFTEEVFGYKRIKYPGNYIEAIFDERFKELQCLKLSARLDLIKSKVSRIFARRFSNEKEYATQPFKEVWNSKKSVRQPTEEFKKMIPVRMQDKKHFVWLEGVLLALGDRTEGRVSKDGNSITFSDLPEELSGLNNFPLQLTGEGSKIRIAIATAAEDWEDETERIKKGDEKIMCFSYQENTVTARYWISKVSLIEKLRSEGVTSEDGQTIKFKNLEGKLTYLNHLPLPLRGNGPIVTISVAEAMKDSEEENIKKGDRMIRCFAI